MSISKFAGIGNFFEVACRQAKDGGADGGGAAESGSALGDGGDAAAILSDETSVTQNVEGDSDGGAAAAAAASGDNKIPQGLFDRIGHLTRQKRELEERLAERDAQLAYAGQGAQSEAPPQGIDPRIAEQEIYHQAQLLSQQQLWKETTDKVWNEGLQKFSDWNVQLHNMANLLGGINPSLTEAAIETGNPTEVLYHLAKNPEEATRVAYLPPARQAVAIAKLAQNLTAPRKTSSAPPPIAPKVNGVGSAPLSLDDKNISMEEWAKLRMQQKSAQKRR